MQADTVNHLIRRISLPSGVVSTLAGQALSIGSTNGVATNARFSRPYGIALDAAGTFAVVVRSMHIREGIASLKLRDGKRSP